MVNTMDNEKIASAMIGHAWEFNTAKSKEKWRNRALDVQTYNFAPELDHDVRETQKHYVAAETELGSWDVSKTTARPGYDYYEYQADRDRLEQRKREESAAAQAAASEEDAEVAKPAEVVEAKEAAPAEADPVEKEAAAEEAKA